MFKDRLGENPPTVSLVGFIAGNTRLYYEKSFPGQIIAELGLKRPPTQQNMILLTKFPSKISLHYEGIGGEINCF